MNTFDDDLRGAMRSKADTQPIHAGDEGMILQITETFRGHRRVWMIIATIGTFLWLGVCVWAGMGFFRASGTRDWIMYATIFLVGVIAVSMLKMWSILEMNHNTHTREIKRVELQLARLAERSK